MGLFSVSKASSSSISTTNQTRNSPTSLQDVEATGVMQAGINYDAGGAINITDSGAIQRMYDTAVASMGTARDLQAESLTFAERASNSAMNFAQEAGRPTETITKQQSYIVLGIAAVAALAAVFIFGSK